MALLKMINAHILSNFKMRAQYYIAINQSLLIVCSSTSCLSGSKAQHVFFHFSSYLLPLIPT